jgi:curved DNA-binding protein CbpA
VRTHYDVLGVTPSATADELKRAYHRRAREHHPDVRPDVRPGAGGDPMVDVNAAWAVLGDPARRRAYDRALAAGLAGGGPGAAPSADGAAREDLADRFEPEPEPAPPRPSDVLVLVPVALLGLAVATFAFSTMTEAPVLLVTAVVLLALAGVWFAATPLLVLRRSVARRSRGPG